MTLAEASRQYQIALEHARRVRTMFAGTLSAEDEIERAITDRTMARERVLDLMVERVLRES
jgi:hypothetical protein